MTSINAREWDQTHKALDNVSYVLTASERTLIARETAGVVQKRLLAWIAFGQVLLLIAACYLAINIHEVYRDRCDFGPAGIVSAQDRPSWCNAVFFFDKDVPVHHVH